MKTHVVLDLHYHPEEGQGCFDGTQQECEAFVATQSPHYMYKVVPMTDEEIEAHPDNQKQIQAHLDSQKLIDINKEKRIKMIVEFAKKVLQYPKGSSGYDPIDEIRLKDAIEKYEQGI